MAEPLYGKYRGTVMNNVDPEQIGRIQAIVPGVEGFIPSSWAMPCLPWGGINTGVFTVPPVGAGVWIEFEQGDPDYPIWTGCFWGLVAERPVLSQMVPPGVPHGGKGGPATSRIAATYSVEKDKPLASPA